MAREAVRFLTFLIPISSMTSYWLNCFMAITGNGESVFDSGEKA